MSYTRRNFIKNTALVTLGAGISLDAIASMRRYVSPNDKIQIGLIGANGMGFANLKSFLKNSEVECVAIADIDDSVYGKRSTELEGSGFKKPTFYKDYRKMLENKDIDVVIVGTPDHWHCLQMVHAVEAGKDVYLEKPIGNSIYEANVMTKAANYHKKVVQVGQWQRSQPHFVDAMNYLQSGKLGRVRTTKTWAYLDWMATLPVKPDGPVPDGVDYNMWLGPALKRPFNPNRFHFHFRWFWDYAGGLMTDWGVHLIDFIMFGTKSDVPKSVLAMGGKMAYPTDAMVTPDTMHAIYDFGDFTMQWEHTIGLGVGFYGRPQGISFIGENGTLVLSRAGWEIIPEKDRGLEKISFERGPESGLDIHTVNFLDCVKNRTPEKLAAPIEVGRKAAVAAHMGNVSLRTGERVYWDKEKNRFTESTANRFIKPKYHNGWVLPKY
ncbi:MAG: Gfo/Idh/MocA family oxidoreductase [Saprospiraceae bacterium]|nr:Gfo/Idh/MocA family oxidoreductase [Saprospiraceae bacterium]